MNKKEQRAAISLIIGEKPTMMVQELSQIIKQSEQWISELFEIQEFDLQKICIANAHSLRKVKNRGDLIKEAETADPIQFFYKCVEEIRKQNARQ